MDQLARFASRRAPGLFRHGCVSSNQPLASRAGLDVLQRGGNAADAAVAAAAVMAVTEPASTGLGGDAFCIFYDAAAGAMKGLNGSGRSPAALTAELLASRGFSEHHPLPERHPLTAMVPGTAAAWADTVQQFGSGKFSLAELLAAAVELATNGWAVTPVSADQWQGSLKLLSEHRRGSELLLDGRAPRIAEVMTLPTMAASLKELGEKGGKQFYVGRVGQAIVDEVQHYGGVLGMEDMARHASVLASPISATYKHVTVWEMPPNGLGVTTLLALNILEGFSLAGMDRSGAEYLHLLIEALKLSFADSLHYVADPACGEVPVAALLSKDYAAARRSLISADKANNYPVHGNPEIKDGGDTIYLCAVDKDGNACSFINSNYMEFGTGIVPQNCGFAVHNRGALFSLDPKSANCVGPSKRCQHTIIPSMVTRTSDGALLACYGIMGGFMQPQAQVQVVLGMVDFGLDPQQALDTPRFKINVTNSQPWGVSLEAEVPGAVAKALAAKGHAVSWPVAGYDRAVFGRGHVITRGAWFASGSRRDVDGDSPVWWAAADPRCDGFPYGY
ncbi:glutathione hydrolase-like YwrD proenzyme [Bacillus rossius redtenbacheri]|uniref:glutathione hydrolase-like YwrD proenzyme n=1 Tax=Bacillus rossius redtenbacheri TaxID=93214 RepID=UPI002FDE603C